MPNLQEDDDFFFSYDRRREEHVFRVYSGLLANPANTGKPKENLFIEAVEAVEVRREYHEF
ncbi:MAG: hypothetical protein KDK45_23525 [Leptospiraceae bacterium]|nr:hypothetical protein [Leptospiraceae bacterium]